MIFHCFQPLVSDHLAHSLISMFALIPIVKLEFSKICLRHRSNTASLMFFAIFKVFSNLAMCPDDRFLPQGKQILPEICQVRPMPNALLSQSKTLIGSSMEICQHLSKTRQPLSTLDIITIYRTRSRFPDRTNN